MCASGAEGQRSYEPSCPITRLFSPLPPSCWQACRPPMSTAKCSFGQWSKAVWKRGGHVLNVVTWGGDMPSGLTQPAVCEGPSAHKCHKPGAGMLGLEEGCRTLWAGAATWGGQAPSKGVGPAGCASPTIAGREMTAQTKTLCPLLGSPSLRVTSRLPRTGADPALPQGPRAWGTSRAAESGGWSGPCN